MAKASWTKCEPAKRLQEHSSLHVGDKHRAVSWKTIKSSMNLKTLKSLSFAKMDASKKTTILVNFSHWND